MPAVGRDRPRMPSGRQRGPKVATRRPVWPRREPTRASILPVYWSSAARGARCSRRRPVSFRGFGRQRLGPGDRPLDPSRQGAAGQPVAANGDEAGQWAASEIHWAACGLASAASAPSGPSLRMSSSPCTPQHMCPRTMNVSPPNMRRSVTSDQSVRSLRTRAASFLSNAMVPTAAAFSAGRSAGRRWCRRNR
jgi:hypothetical protein